MLDREVRADPVADFPLLHPGPNGDDLTSTVGARDEVVVRAARVLILGDDNVAVLYGAIIMASGGVKWVWVTRMGKKRTFKETAWILTRTCPS